MSNYFERSIFSIFMSILNKSTSQNYSHTNCICENDKFQIMSTASAKLFFWAAWKPLEAILQNRAWGDPRKTHWKDSFRMSYCVKQFFWALSKSEQAHSLLTQELLAVILKITLKRSIVNHFDCVCAAFLWALWKHIQADSLLTQNMPAVILENYIKNLNFKFFRLCVRS